MLKENMSRELSIMRMTYRILIIALICLAMTGSALAQETPSQLPSGNGAVTLPAPVPGEQKGYYAISSSPSGASVSFDGTNYGATPVTVEVSTTGTPGHTIVVSLSGYQTWNQFYSGNPLGGQTVNVFAQLIPVPAGSIHVGSSPTGATAVLDGGQDQTITPGAFTSVAPGWHTVQVSMAGYQPYSTSMQVSQGGTSEVYANLVQKPQTGSISVKSSPAGAGLYIDGIYEGETDQVVGNLRIGSHTIVLKLAGYQTWSNTYQVNPGQTTFVTAALVPIQSPQTGDLQVSSTPSGASVYLNGNYQGITSQSKGPLDVTGVSPGTYTVLLKKSGYQDYTTTTQILAGQTSQVFATLQQAVQPPATASAELTSEPSGADVYVNNVYLGITPLASQTAPVGTYNVTVKMEGYNPYSTSVTLTAGQSVHINAALSPIAPPPPVTPAIPTTLIVAGGVILVVIIGIIAYVLTRPKKKNPEMQGQEPQKTEDQAKK
jgi:hypothetical protein